MTLPGAIVREYVDAVDELARALRVQSECIERARGRVSWDGLPEKTTEELRDAQGWVNDCDKRHARASEALLAFVRESATEGG